MKKLAALFLVCVFAVPAIAKDQKKPVRPPDSAPAAPQPQFSEKLYDGMKWRMIGPYRGGRVLAVTGVPGQPNTYYFGAVAGGVWKTTDGGGTWQPMSDKEPFWSVGAIAVAPSNPSIIYVGTGEACIRGDITYGNGMWKSVDGGRSWKHIGLEDTRQIGRVLVDPHNPDVVFVAALGHAFGPNAERGVFRTTDGGATWQKVLYKDDKTGAIDLSFDPGSPSVIFASLYEARRSPWELVSGGPGSGLYRSTDGGTTWKQLTGNGLPKGVLGRIGIAVSPANPERVYAIIEAEKGGLYRSDNGGDNWTAVNSDSRFTQRSWYYGHIFADPKNADTVYILNVGMFRSNDAGKSWVQIRAPHGDNHGLWINPDNPQHMINGNDGGATISTDGGKTWSSLMNQPTAQFYHVATDDQYRYRVYGAQQDNSTISIASSTDSGTIGATDWYPVGGGEAGFVVPYLPDPNIVFAGSYDGLITRYDKSTGQLQDVNPWPDNPMGSGAAPLKYRFQWTAPIALSPHDPNVLYHAANVLFRSTNLGQSWTAISPDLTRNDKSKQGPSGGPITKDNTSVEYYDVIFAVAESPVQKGLIWAGSDDGLIHLTRDAGAHWDNVTPKDLPEWSTVSLIDASSHDAGTAYLAVDRHRLDDIAPYIYVTHDFGKTWSKIVNGIPVGSFVHAVRQDPVDAHLLYAGTESGVFISWNDGALWQPLKLNLPPAPVHDLVVKNDGLVVATHGRSFWILDDLTPLRQVAASTNADVYFYKPAAAHRQRGRGFVIPGAAIAAPNPPGPAVFDYFFKTAPQGEVTLEILDAQGKQVRKVSSAEPPKPRKVAEVQSEFEEFLPAAQPRLPIKEGMNRFTWDLRYDPPSNIPGLAQWGGRPRGVLAIPGMYTARLVVAGKQYDVPLELKGDPRVKTVPAAYAAQFELASTIARRIGEANDAVNQMREIRSQIGDLKERFEKDARAKDVLAAADALDKKVTPVEETIAQTRSKASEDPLNFPIRLNNKLLLLQGTVESADTAPTQQATEVFQELSKQLDAALGQWKQILSTDVPALNSLVQKSALPAISVSPPQKE
ncbi:MAG: WD40/YVTN/BNR-like repeat-containing protein [Terriglobales bacterium]